MAEIKLNNPKWIGSAEGLVRKSITVPADFATYVTEVDASGCSRKIVKSGTYFSTPYKGLLFNDVDITAGEHEGSLVIGGRYIDAKLPTSVASNASDLIAQGLYAISEGSTTRPAFGGYAQLSKLTAPTLTDVSQSTKFTWVAITGATGYKVYKGTTLVDEVATTDTLEYAYSTNSGSYTVVALGDNLYKLDSDKSTAVVVA